MRSEIITLLSPAMRNNLCGLALHCFNQLRQSDQSSQIAQQHSPFTTFLHAYISLKSSHPTPRQDPDPPDDAVHQELTSIRAVLHVKPESREVEADNSLISSTSIVATCGFWPGATDGDDNAENPDNNPNDDTQEGTRVRFDVPPTLDVTFPWETGSSAIRERVPTPHAGCGPQSVQFNASVPVVIPRAFPGILEVLEHTRTPPSTMRPKLVRIHSVVKCHPPKASGRRKARAYVSVVGRVATPPPATWNPPPPCQIGLGIHVEAGDKKAGNRVWSKIRGLVQAVRRTGSNTRPIRRRRIKLFRGMASDNESTAGRGMWKDIAVA